MIVIKDLIPLSRDYTAHTVLPLVNIPLIDPYVHTVERCTCALSHAKAFFAERSNSLFPSPVQQVVDILRPISALTF